MLRTKHHSPLEPTEYDSTLDVRKNIQKSTLAWWQNPVVLVLLTILFSIIDAVTLYTVLDKIFTNAYIFTYIFAMGVALMLNLTLIFLAKVLRTLQRSNNKAYMCIAVLLVTTFVALMAITFNLRFQTRYSDVTSSSSLFTTTETQETTELSDQEEGQIMAATLVLGFSPAFTSVICFVIAYFDDQLKRKMNVLEIAIINHNTAIGEIDSTIEQIMCLKDNYKEYLYQQNEDLLADNIALSKSISNTIKGLARFKLAESLGNAESVSHITKSVTVNHNSP